MSENIKQLRTLSRIFLESYGLETSKLVSVTMETLKEITLDDMKDLNDIIECMIPKGYRLAYFDYLLKMNMCSEKTVANFLYEHWTRVEKIYKQGLAKTKIIKLLKMADKEQEFYDKLEQLPEEITVYRGVDMPDYKSMSWTTDKEKAEWFATRFKCVYLDRKGYVYYGTLPKDKVIALFDSRNESEVVCDWKHIKDIQMYNVES